MSHWQCLFIPQFTHYFAKWSLTSGGYYSARTSALWSRTLGHSSQWNINPTWADSILALQNYYANLICAMLGWLWPSDSIRNYMSVAKAGLRISRRFWRHPFIAEDPLVNNRCTGTSQKKKMYMVKKFIISKSETFTFVYIFIRQGSSHLLNMQNVHLLFIIKFVCLSAPHTVVAYFDAAKFSIKLFSFIYFIVSVVRQWDEYEILTETWPIKTTHSPHPKC